MINDHRELYRVDAAGVEGPIPITGLTSSDVIMGVKRNEELVGGTSQTVYRIVTSDYDEVTAWRLDLSGSLPLATDPCLVDGGNWSPQAWPIVGYGSNISGSLGVTNPFSAMLDADGYLYGPPGCFGSPGSGLLMPLGPTSGEADSAA